jgi:hypothetical protein
MGKQVENHDRKLIFPCWRQQPHFRFGLRPFYHDGKGDSCHHPTPDGYSKPIHPNMEDNVHWYRIGEAKRTTRREKIAQARRRTSQNLTPDESVTTHSGNIEIGYREITSVEIKRRFFQSQLRLYVFEPPTTRRIIHFNLSKKQIPEAQRLLERVLLSKIKGK